MPSCHCPAIVFQMYGEFWACLEARTLPQTLLQMTRCPALCHLMKLEENVMLEYTRAEASWDKEVLCCPCCLAQCQLMKLGENVMLEDVKAEASWDQDVLHCQSKQ